MIVWLTALLLLGCPAPPSASTEGEEAAVMSTADLDPALLAACEAELGGQIPTFDVHFTALLPREEVDFPPSDVASCDGDETRWPCSHLRALEQNFVTAEGGPVCDPADPSQCVTFRYASHTVIRGPEDSDCPELWYRARQGMDPTKTSAEGYTQIRAAARDCADPRVLRPGAINVLLFDDPVPGARTSFATRHDTRWAPLCTPYVTIERGRLPTEAGSVEFYSAANEHEMGHIFGLDHTCRSPADPRFPSSNIMQGTGGSCCCECAEAKNYEPGSIWAESVCVDCAALDEADRCTPDSAYAQCDQPDCTRHVTNGDRAEGFTDAEIGEHNTGEGQIAVIIAEARALHACWCAQERLQASPR